MVCKLKTGPPIEPVTINDYMDQRRIDSNDETLFINSLLLRAREEIERLCGPLISQTWYQYEDCWPDSNIFRLGKPRVQSTSFSLKYQDVNAVSHTFASTNYVLDINDVARPKVVLKYSASWPGDVLLESSAITAEFICGFGLTAASVPETLRAAILLLAAHWDENREPYQNLAGGNLIPTELPYMLDQLISQYRHWGWEYA